MYTTTTIRVTIDIHKQEDLPALDLEEMDTAEWANRARSTRHYNHPTILIKRAIVDSEWEGIPAELIDDIVSKVSVALGQADLEIEWPPHTQPVSPPLAGFRLPNLKILRQSPNLSNCLLTAADIDDRLVYRTYRTYI